MVQTNSAADGSATSGGCRLDDYGYASVLRHARGCSRDHVHRQHPLRRRRQGGGHCAAATSFVARARIIGATLNEVGDDVEDVCSVVSDLVVSQGEFLGIDFDYLTKMVRVGSKTLRKLRLLYDVLKTGRFTYQNLIAMFGILFFAMQVTRPAAAKHFYALKEYSRVARLVQRDPALLPTEYKCSASRLAVIVRWVEETLANPWVDVVAQVPAGDSEYLLVTDASAWGWGAILWNWRTGNVFDTSQPWERAFRANKVSTWAESEAIARAVQHFFPEGPTASLAVLTDSGAAVGAFTKGRSGVYALNRSVKTVQDAGFYSAPLSFGHIPGAVNPADGLSRGQQMGEEDKKKATEQVFSLIMG
eukprot:PhM_4_TR15886/c2_g1_i1/m.17016